MLLFHGRQWFKHLKKVYDELFPQIQDGCQISLGSQMAYFDWTQYLELYNILLAFWNLIDVQINNSVDAALSPLRDFSI